MTLEQLDALEQMIRDPDSAPPIGPQNVVTLREAALGVLRLAKAGLRLRASIGNMNIVDALRAFDEAAR